MRTSDRAQGRSVGEDDDPDGGHEGIQPWAHAFVTSVLVLFTICGLIGLEAWPLSGFRLFSAPRSATWTSFRGELATEDGLQRLQVRELPGSYRAFGLLFAELARAPIARRREVCRAFADAASTGGTPIVELRVFRIVHRVYPRGDDGPAVPPARNLVIRCRPSRDVRAS